MKFTLAQSQLAQALAAMIPLVPQKSTIPILTNIHLELKDNQLRLTATDLEASMLYKLATENSSPGAVCVPARRLFDVIHELPDIPLEISCSNNRATIKSANGNYRITGIDPEEFPRLNEGIATKSSFACKTQEFVHNLNTAAFACSKDDTRTTLMGVLLEMQTAGLNYVATDGHRLIKISTPFTNADQQQVILPTKTISLLSRACTADEILIALSDDSALLRCGNVTFVSRLISGTYPHYNKVMPRENNLTATLDREQFFNALKRVRLLSHKNKRAIALAFSRENLIISGNDSENNNDAEESLPAVFDGEPVKIGMNADYVMDALRQLSSEQVVIKIKDEATGVYVEPLPQAPDTIITIVQMPLRLDE